MYFALLWHHHQPIYRDPNNNQYLLPYVNYHLTKNYYQMYYLAEESGFPCVFNLVPCLIEQIMDYGQGQARDPLQIALEKDPHKLTPEEIELLSRFIPGGRREENKPALQLQALRSLFPPLLQVPEDKESLLRLQKELHQEVLSGYKKLRQEGWVELTTSAYYHPLLPLLFDLAVGEEPLMPALAFRYPEDAQAQIEKGRDYFHQSIGHRPHGFWPSEGGISREVARAIFQAGFSYALTDENVLWKSLKKAPDPASLLKPYLCENLAIFFRDRELSNLISFEYHRWNEKDAVRHFISKLEARCCSRADEAITVVALDGENPWAGYKENGVPFLREFYDQLKKAPGVEPILLKDYLAFAPPKKEIELLPGTWLGSFSRWVGHPAKNAAWEKLSLTREECGPSEEIYVAEGSDWFWWFGEGGDAEFQTLFDGYLARARRKKEGSR